MAGRIDRHASEIRVLRNSLEKFNKRSRRSGSAAPTGRMRYGESTCLACDTLRLYSSMAGGLWKYRTQSLGRESCLWQVSSNIGIEIANHEGELARTVSDPARPEKRLLNGGNPSSKLADIKQKINPPPPLLTSGPFIPLISLQPPTSATATSSSLLVTVSS
jgi:hypothetical protein